MLSSHKVYALVMRILHSPIFKGGRVAVALVSGNYAVNLDQGTVFDMAVTGNGTVTFTCSDPTKCYQFQLNAVTTGAYSFTSYIFSGVTAYKRSGATLALVSSGRTTFGCTYDGPAATLDIYDVQMATV